MLSLKVVQETGVHLQGSRLLVRTPTLRDAEALVDLMRNDEDLRRAAGMSPAAGQVTPMGFLSRLDEWRQHQNIVPMAIVGSEGTAIGLISLSRVDETARTGRIGYWLGSRHWGQGHATAAFELVLGLARQLGLHRVSATVARDNIASWRLWARHGAAIGDRGEGKLTCTLDLPTLPGVDHSP